MDDRTFEVANEFAAVEIGYDDSGNGPRLRLVDKKTGSEGFLDPLQLESLVYATPKDMDFLLDPGNTRWAKEEAARGGPSTAAANGPALS